MYSEVELDRKPPSTLPASISLPAIPASAAEARHWLSALAASWGSRDREDAALLCVSELVANVASHADSVGFTVSIAQEPDALRIEVSDDDPRMGPRRQRATTAYDESGRGLGIVEALALEWGVYNRPGDGKAVWLKL